jgi:hypothetical protein
VTEGTNRLIDPYDATAIEGAVAQVLAAPLLAADEALAAPLPAAARPELWDGHAAQRIVAVIADWAVGRVAPWGR